jgi:hypothetical protein
MVVEFFSYLRLHNRSQHVECHKALRIMGPIWASSGTHIAAATLSSLELLSVFIVVFLPFSLFFVPRVLSILVLLYSAGWNFKFH